MYNQAKLKKIIFVLVAVAVIFGAGVFAGRVWTLRTILADGSNNVEIVRLVNLYSQSRSSVGDFNQFWDLWNLVKQKYVNQPVDDVKLFYGAMEGMVAGLGDPYSIYFPPQKAEEFAKDLSGQFEGIGAEVDIRNKQLIVVAPLPGSPAEKAGLKANDKIFAVDGADTSGLNLDEAIKKIRGTAGTQVKLLITHDKSNIPQELVITRAKINVPTVSWEKKGNGIIYLRLSYFNENTWSEFDKAVNDLLKESPKGIIFDLRTNPGGYLDTAVAIGSEWLKTGSVVSEKFSDDKENSYPVQGQHRLAGIKTIILVDENSASASEIVAGALQDAKVAKLVGKKTYGKGSVQDFQVLPDGSALKITVAKWYTPLGRQIDKNGIAPDVVVEPMFQEIKDAKAGEAQYKDMGLEKALELLK